MESKFLVMPNPEDLNVDDAVTVFRDIQDGYTSGLQDVYLKAKNFENFLADLVNEYGEYEKFDYSHGKNSLFARYVNEHFRLYVRGNAIDLFMGVYCKSDETSAKIWKIFTSYAEPSTGIDIFGTSYFMNGTRVDESMKNIKPEDLNYIDKEFYPYIDTDLMFDQFFTGNENIMLLVGEPGLGKSKLSTLAIKHAFENPNTLPYDKMIQNSGLDEQFINVGYVKSIDVLTDDKFWRTLETSEMDIIVIDDLDYMLTKRDAELSTSDDAKKNAFLNQFLSFTDGVEKNQTKFIITTNQTYSDIDTALLRKGRLFDIIELRRLTNNEALKIWENNNLSADIFKELFTEDTVLSADLGSEISKHKNTRIEQSTKSYMLEDGISKIQKAKRSKRIGL